MLLLFAAVALLIGGGAFALALPSSSRRQAQAGAGSAFVGSLLGAAFALQVLVSGAVATYREAWAVPFSSLYLEADALSAFFLLVVFLVSALSSLFGGPYLSHHTSKRPLGPAWFHFNALVVSMALVAVARNGVLFLIAWEAMALTSFFLVMHDGRDREVARAGWTYLVASHLGTAFVVAFFALLGAAAGSLDFDRIAALGPPGATMSGVLFVLALVGFGTKAGFVPLHVWLPEAHPAAPSHVSALMSGAMIKLGIYGVVRALTLLGPPDLWWGWLLVAVGISSGVMGVLLALAQHDLKRLLAYHSVENIGIIALGLGVGVLGLSAGARQVAFLGFAGAILHVLNHALFKSLLFFGAGAVQTAVGTRDIERLGGLMRRMPTTGASFLTGSAAISGLPPLNGFVSEFLIFGGAFLGAISLAPSFAIPLSAAAGALALIGGLASACFVKAVGIVFLGEPRSAEAASAHEVGRLMQAPMVAAAGACVAIGLLAPVAVEALVGPVATASGLSTPEAEAGAAFAAAALAPVALAGGVLLALVLALTALRRGLLSGRAVASAPTWDCGYTAPSPRMQYTASSFAAPLTHHFRAVLRTRFDLEAPDGLFPKRASLHSHTPDVFLARGFVPVFTGARRLFGRALILQNGRVQVYVLYLVLTLVGLLLWELW